MRRLKMMIPMSAFLSAGESLTPSPVTATMAPCLWHPSTMMSFCWGEVRANTISVWCASVWSIWAGVMSRRSEPCTTQALASLNNQFNDWNNSQSITQSLVLTHKCSDTNTHIQYIQAYIYYTVYTYINVLSVNCQFHIPAQDSNPNTKRVTQGLANGRSVTPRKPRCRLLSTAGQTTARHL